jgi:hypothetical protein
MKMSNFDYEEYQNSKLRLRYSPQQLSFNRALKAQTLCMQGGFIDDVSHMKAEIAKNSVVTSTHFTKKEKSKNKRKTSKNIEFEPNDIQTEIETKVPQIEL